MAAITIATNYDNSTDATFQAWVTAIHNSILACGLITSSDAGQLPIASVHTPGAGNTYPVYRVYAFNDSLQSQVSASVTYSVFVKVKYGSGNTAAMPQITVQAGNQTNASGTFTGNAFSLEKTIGGQAFVDASTPTYNSYISGTSSRITCALWKNHPNIAGSGFFSVERFQDVTGNDNINGFHVHLLPGPANGGFFIQSMLINPPIAPPTTETNIIALFSSNNPTQWGEGFAFSPSIPWMGQFGNPSNCVGAYMSGDFPSNGGIFHALHYGNIQKWFATGMSYAGGGGRTVAMRFE